MNYNLNDFIVNIIKSKTMMPSTRGAGLTLMDILEVINTELYSYITPKLLSVREEYLVDTIEVNSAEPILEYPIPDNAVGKKLRDVLVRDAQGNVFNLPRLEPEDLPQYNYLSKVIRAFYIEDDKLKIVGNISAPYKLVIKYFKRLDKHIIYNDTDNNKYYAGKVTSKNNTNKTIVVDNIPESFTVDLDVALFSLVKGKKQENKITNIDINNKIITLANSIDDIDLTEQVYISKKGETPIFLLPREMENYVINRVCMVMALMLGDRDMYNIFKAETMTIEDCLISMFSERVEGEQEKIVNHTNMAWKKRIIW